MTNPVVPEISRHEVASMKKGPRESPLKKFVRDNGLLLVFFGTFLVFWIGESFVGLRAYNEDQKQHGQPPTAYSEYIKSPHFLEHSAENWESEFLEMFSYVILTTFLFQKGSPQ